MTTFHGRRQNGFTLLEVLVAVLILTVGLLGMAGLQVTGLAHNHGAFLRTQATLQAYDLADRARANLGADYAATVAAEHPECEDGGCTPQQLAENDLYRWHLANAALLPEGRGTICRDATPADGSPADPQCDGGGAFAVIKLWWLDGQQRAERRFVTSFQP